MTKMSKKIEGNSPSAIAAHDNSKDAATVYYIIWSFTFAGGADNTKTNHNAIYANGNNQIPVYLDYTIYYKDHNKEVDLTDADIKNLGGIDIYLYESTQQVDLQTYGQQQWAYADTAGEFVNAVVCGAPPPVESYSKPRMRVSGANPQYNSHSTFYISNTGGSSDAVAVSPVIKFKTINQAAFTGYSGGTNYVSLTICANPEYRYLGEISGNGAKGSAISLSCVPHSAATQSGTVKSAGNRLQFIDEFGARGEIVLDAKPPAA